MKGTISRALGCVVVCLGLGAIVRAGEQPASPPGVLLEHVAATLKEKYPKTTVKSVRESGLTGIYEVITGNNVLYTDVSGRYLLIGHLYDMENNRDLTAQRQVARRAIEFPARALPQAIKTVHGQGRRVVAVFSDPNCGYCKRLEAALQSVDDLTIYTFLYPVLDGSVARAMSVWCAPDAAQTWRRWMLEGHAPAALDCANPINENIALGQAFGIRGTPTLIARDGRVLYGAVDAARIDSWLGHGQTVKTGLSGEAER